MGTTIGCVPGNLGGLNTLLGKDLVIIIDITSSLYRYFIQLHWILLDTFGLDLGLKCSVGRCQLLCTGQRSFKMIAAGLLR